MALKELPNELISQIAAYLGADELFSFSLSCKHFTHLLRNENVCRSILERHRFSLEYKDAERAGSFAKGLRRLVKRHDAVKTARPFQVEEVALGKSFLLCNGALCFVSSFSSFSVFDTRHGGPYPKMYSAIIPPQSPRRGTSVMQSLVPLYYSHSILSCLGTFAEPRVSGGTHYFSAVCVYNFALKYSWWVRSPEGTEKVFVRNNTQNYYFGSFGPMEDGGGKSWHITGCTIDLNPNSTVWRDFHLDTFHGEEIGSDTCFEIIDGFFYCVTSQTSATPEDGVRNSYYQAARLSLADPTARTFQVPSKKTLWRRGPAEGAIDERWSLLSLNQDEVTGKIYIHESRKEWLGDSSQSQRICYRKELNFLDGMCTESLYDPVREQIPALHQQVSVIEPGQETYSEPRLPDDIHHGDNGSWEGDTIPFYNCFLHYYNPSSSTFLELSNEPIAPWSATQSLRLRMRAKALPVHRKVAPVSTQQDEHAVADQNAQPRRGGDLRHWPNGQMGLSSGQIMSHDHQDPAQARSEPLRLTGFADERFVVYAQRPVTPEGHCSLVLISFDPGVNLAHADIETYV